MIKTPILLVAWMAVMSASCGVVKDVVGDVDQPKKESSRTNGSSPLSKLELVPSAATLTPGDEFRFHAEFLDSAGVAKSDPAGIAWETTASDVLEMRGDGVVVAKKLGDAKVIISLGDVKAEATVSVQAPASCTALAEFTKLAQPVVDDKCVACHSDNGSKAANGAFAMNPGASDQNWQGAKSRINSKDLPSSKFLRKVLGEDGHGGGSVLKADEEPYRNLMAWATAEAKCMNGETLTALIMTPTEATIKAGTRIRLKVEGKNAAGAVQEITQDLEWKLESDGVPATVDVAAMGADSMLTVGAKVGKITATAKHAGLEASAVVTVVPFDAASSCEAVATYKKDVDPIVQASCLGCHGSSGSGATAMTLNGPNPTDTERLLNHAELLQRLKLTQVSESLLLGKITNKVPHLGGAVVPADSANHAKVLAWADGEAACFQATATGLTIAPTDPTVTAGETLAMRALVRHPDDSLSPAGQGVTWKLEGTSMLAQVPEDTTISADGLLSTSVAGGVTVVASFGTFSAKTTVTINPVSTADIQSIQIKPAGPVSLPVGAFQQLVLEVLYANGSKAYNPAEAQYSVMNGTIADVEDRILTAKAIGETQVAASFGGKSSAITVKVTALDCPSYSSFVANFQPILDQSCVGCHGSDGSPAATAVKFKPGATCQQRYVNWVNAKAELDQSDLLASKLLRKPLGELMHGGDVVLDAAGADKLKTWMAVAGACYASAPALEAAAQDSICPKAVKQIALTPEFPTVTVGSGLDLSALVTFDDDSTATNDADLTWTSGNDDFFTVQEKAGGGARITGVAPGNAKIVVTLRDVTREFDVTVKSATATVTSLLIQPASPSIGLGQTKSLTLRATYSDGTTAVLSQNVAWSSENTDKATISDAGLVTSKAAGAATINAVYSGADCAVNCSATTALTVLGIQSITVSPSSKTIEVGRTQPLTASVKYSDDSTYVPAATAFSWTSSAPSVATVSSSGVVTGKAGGSSTVSATFKGSTGSSSFTVQVPAGCSSFTTFRAAGSGVGAVLEAKCKTCHAPNGIGAASFEFPGGASTCQQIAGVWAKAKAKVNLSEPEKSPLYTKPSGLVGHSGMTVLNATEKETFRVWTNLSASCQVANLDSPSVAELCPKQPLSIALNPAAPALIAGNTLNVVATVTYDDGSTSTTEPSLAWTSGATSTFTVAKTAAGATVSGVAPGTAVLTVKAGTVEKTVSVVVQSATATLTGLAIEPATLSVGLGQTKALSLKASYSDGTSKTLNQNVTWASADQNVATISSAGLVTSKTAGVSAITATFTDPSCTANCAKTRDLTVLAVKAVTVTPANKSLNVGLTQQLAVSLAYTDNSTFNLPAASAAWSSSATAKATVSASGLVTSKAGGSATITATYGGKSGTSAFTLVAPANCSTFPAFRASGAGNIAQILETSCKSCHGSGGIGAGSFTFPTGATSCAQQIPVWTAAKGKVNQTSPLSSTFYTKPSGLEAHGGLKVLTDAQIDVFKAWVQASAACQVAGVDVGTTEQLCPKQPVSIALNPPNPTVTVGQTLALVATVTYDDGSTSTTDASLTWTSATPATFTVTKTAAGATASGVAPGTANLSVKVGVIEKVVPMVVQAAGVTLTSLVVDPATQSLGVGQTKPYVLKGNYSDGTTRILNTNVTWASTDTAKATVSTAGLVTAVAAGTPKIRATYSDASCTANCTVEGSLTVLGVQSVLLTPATKTLTVGQTQQVAVSVKYTDNSTFTPPNNQVSWTTSASSKATVSSTGLVTGKAAGTATISAAFKGATGTSAFTLQMPAGCHSFTTFKTPTSGVGALLEAKCKTCHTGSGQGTAYFQFPAGASTCQQIAGVWSAAKEKVDLTDVNASPIYAKPAGLISHVGGSNLLDATQKETFRVWATLSASCQTAGADTKTVAELCPKQVQSITVNPAAPSLIEGATLNLVATVTYDDGSTSTTDSALAWSSANTAKFTVVKTAAGATVTGVASGTANLSVKVGTFEKLVAVVVQSAAATLTSLVIEPATSSLGLGQTKALVLKGNYSDGTTKVLSQNVTWTSSDTAKATISAAGVVTPKLPGAVTITAAFADTSCSGGSCTKTTTVTVLDVKTVAVTPNPKTLTVGQTQQMAVTLTYTDNSTYVLPVSSATWTTSASSKATVSTSGLVTGKGAGTATISAAFSGKTGAATFTLNMPQGCPTYGKFRAQGANIAQIMESKCKDCHTTGGIGAANFVFPGGATTCVAQIPLWNAAKTKVNPANALTSKFYTKPSAIEAHGGSKALNDQQIEIFKSWVQTSAVCQAAGVDVGTNDELCPKIPQSIAISPSTPEVRLGRTTQLTATVTFDDGSTSTTMPVTWTSSATAKATVDTDGTLTAVAIGTTNVTAAFGGVSATAVAKVIDADVTRIDVVPLTTEIPSGDTIAFSVKATYSNNTQGTLTTGVTWSSTKPAFATISNAGLALGVAKGTATIKATLASCANVTNCPASGTLTVKDPVLRSIAITPGNLVVTSGIPATLKVRGTYSDGSVKDVGTGITWTTDDSSTADVTSTGVVTGAAPGLATIRAAVSGVATVETGVLVLAANGCSTVQKYQNSVDPLFQGKCIGCHGTGGRGAGFMQLNKALTAFDKLSNWDEVRKRIKATDVLNSTLLRKIRGELAHTGGALMPATSTDYAAVKSWAESEALCIKENIPTNLTRNSGEVLFKRLQTLFPQAVSTTATDAKPLVARQFDMYYSSGLDRVLANAERGFSPVVLVSMRNKVNAVCQDYVDAADTKNTLFTWDANSLLAGESVPTNAVDKIVLIAARKAWLYPYVATDAEVGHLRTLYNAAAATNTLLAKKMVCVAALSSPQFWFGNKGSEDALRRLYLETLRKIPTMADYKAYRATAAANRVAYMKGLVGANKATFLTAVKSWTRDWLALRDYYDINRGQVRPEAGIGTGSTSTATGLGGVPVAELTMDESGFDDAIQVGNDRNSAQSPLDYSENCDKTVEQNFDPRTTSIRYEHFNPMVNKWETVGTMRRAANGTWTSENGAISLNAAGTSKKTTSLADITTTSPNSTGQQCYKVGRLVGTPVECFTSARPSKVNMQRRIRRVSPSGDQNGYSKIKLWWSGEEVHVCNTYSRFAMTCAYRPADPTKTTMTGAVDYQKSLITAYGATPWNFKDGDRPKLGPPQLRDSLASPKVLDSYRCGVPDGEEIAKNGSSGYVEDLAYPKGYANQTAAIVQADLNQIATSATEFFKRNAVGLDRIISLNKDANSRAESQALGRLLEDLQAEPLNLVNDIVGNDRDFRLFLTADYTFGHTELDLFYRSSGYYLPAYPPGYVPKRGSANTALQRISESQIDPIPTPWMKSSWGTYGLNMNPLSYFKDEVTDGEINVKPMSGILTQTAFLGPVSVNSGKVRSIAARVFQRLLCGLPSDFVADLDSNAVSLHKAMVSTAPGNGNAHVDESRGCYSCHINLDPMASTLKAGFKASPDGPMINDLKYAPLLGIPFVYGVRGGKPVATGAVFGETVSGIKDLGFTLSRTRQFSECVVKTGFVNMFGRQPVGEEVGMINDVAEAFRNNGYSYQEMIESLISKDEYRRPQ